MREGTGKKVETVNEKSFSELLDGLFDLVDEIVSRAVC